MSSQEGTPTKSTRKRNLDHDGGRLETETPTKRRRGSVTTDASVGESSEEDDEVDVAAAEVKAIDLAGNSSTPRRRGRPPKNKTVAAAAAAATTATTTTTGDSPTPKAQRFATFETPTKRRILDAESTPGRKAGADRSARRKSAKALIEQVVGDGDTDDDEDDDEGALVREIYGSGGEDEETRAGADAGGTSQAASTEGDDPLSESAPETPSKARRGGGSGRGRGGRPRARSPTPPRDLPPHELYFAQNKPGRPKTSDNSLSSLSLLTHDEYFSILAGGGEGDRHAGDIAYLESLHAESFPQWTFELLQGFSVCLYGLGSKRRLLQRLAKELYAHGGGGPGQQKHSVVVINGYAPSTSMRDILATIASAVDPSRRIPAAPPAVMAQSILAHLDSAGAALTLVAHSVDATPLRRQAHQAVLSQLAAHPRVRLACSVDTPDFPLLWDVSLRSAFNFAFHDCTTYAPFSVELDVVDDVHELLGRKARRVNGREGVAFVLKSLPENAKNLFQLIVGEVLVAAEEEGGEAEDAGVEYRMLYNKAVEEFICSSEMAFRTLLKEYVFFMHFFRKINFCPLPIWRLLTISPGSTTIKLLPAARIR